MRWIFGALLASFVANFSKDVSQNLAELTVNLNALARQLSPIPPAPSVKKVPHLIGYDQLVLMSDIYNVNAVAQGQLPLKKDGLEIAQAVVVWQMLDYNEFFKLPLNALDTTGAIMGINVRNYIELLRNRNNELYRQRAPIQVDDTILVLNIGGLDASCGYHALKNGIDLVRASRAPTAQAEQKELANLLDLTSMLKLFGSAEVNQAVLGQNNPGKWRAFMMTIRRRQAAGYAFDQQAHTIRDLFLGNKPVPADVLDPITIGLGTPMDQGDVWNLYGQILVNYFRELKEGALQNIALQGPFVFKEMVARDEIIAVIKSLTKMLGITSDELHVIQNSRVIDSYLKPAVTHTISIELRTEEDWDALASTIRRETNSPFILNGDWLHADDIELIIREEKKSGGMLENVNLEVSFLETKEEIGNVDFNPKLNQALRDLRTKADFTHIVIVKPSGAIESGIAQGPHWIGAFINKVKGNMQVIVTDSENASHYQLLNQPNLPLGALIQALMYH